MAPTRNNICIRLAALECVQIQMTSARTLMGPQARLRRLLGTLQVPGRHQLRPSSNSSISPQFCYQEPLAAWAAHWHPHGVHVPGTGYWGTGRVGSWGVGGGGVQVHIHRG